MSQIMEICTETAQNYPELNSGDLKNIIMGAIEAEIPEMFAEIDLSHDKIMWGVLKGQKFRNRLKKNDSEKAKVKEQERLDKINSILSVKNTLEGESSVLDLVNQSKSIQEPYDEFKHPHMFANYMGVVNEYPMDYDYSYESLRSSDNISVKNEKSSLYDAIKLVTDLSNNNVSSYELIYDKVFDKILNIKMDLNAKDALELWIELIDNMDAKHAKMINLEWNGEINISEEDFVDYVVKIMLKSGIGPRALDGFDAVEAVSEGRR